MHDIAARIKIWDHEDIEDLRSMLEDLHGCCDDYQLCGIDISDLPSEDIPDDIDTGYPVWAMDKHGLCLVGAELDLIETLDEIRGL